MITEHVILPSNRPEKLSVARQRFFFLFLFLASGMSMGWLEGMSVKVRMKTLLVKLVFT